MAHERQLILKAVSSAMKKGARQAKACEVIGVSAKTLQRWSKADNDEDGRLTAVRTPLNKLTELECQRIIKLSNSPEYAHLPPNQIVPKLADQGIYLASESSFYRILKAHNQLAHRQTSRPATPRKRPRALTATGPNQIYSWDITYLPTRVRGSFLYLYLVLDIYSRKIVGWQVHDEERSALAAELMVDISARENLKPEQVTLHSDNGSPMKGATLLATLQELGIMPSFSRPSVSNDNPYSESLFRTLKYRPEYPEQAFMDIKSAREWVSGFVQWYNEEHRHSGINYVTPAERHKGLDKKILTHRKTVYLNAKAVNPTRWSGKIRSWEEIEKVYLNPEKGKTESKNIRAA